MAKTMNYKIPFSIALQEIRNIGDPRSMKPDLEDFNWDSVQETSIFSFGGKDFRREQEMVETARQISITTVKKIIHAQSLNFCCPLEIMEIAFKPKEFSEVYFVVHDTIKHELFFFRAIEDSPRWQEEWFEERTVTGLMKKYGARQCKHIYLMLGNAYQQIVNHNDNISDPGRGYNSYSLKWFFEEYFGVDEYNRFYIALQDYIQEVDEYLDYIRLSLLTPTASINLRKNIQFSLKSTDYEKILSTIMNINMDATTIKCIKEQFIDQNVLEVMLGDHDFAESLLTAEWLYDSMKKAKAIDLTVIGMGYLKSVEQLLYELICLHSDQGYLIQEVGKARGETVFLNQYTIKTKMIDTTIGSMEYFYRNNSNIVNGHRLFRNTVDIDIPKIIDAIRQFKEVRNGFFHKDNITAWRKIEEIRSISLSMMFLLLGSHDLSENDLQQLGMSKNTMSTDYHQLCEYINYHRGEVFVFVNEEDEDMYFVSCYDKSAKPINGRNMIYSGAYFKELGQDGKRFVVLEDETPYAIYLGKIVFEKQTPSPSPVRTKKIFEKGKFVGPSIAEEERIRY